MYIDHQSALGDRLNDVLEITSEKWYWCTTNNEEESSQDGGFFSRVISIQTDPCCLKREHIQAVTT